MRIAYLSPLNPAPTGIADYSEELLPALGRLAEIDLFVDGYTPGNAGLREAFPVHDCAELAAEWARRRYDVALYHMGNSAAHAGIYRTLLELPGVVVLHDVVLHHFLHETTLHRGDARAYLRELAYCHGLAGLAAARRLLRGEALDPFAFPAFHRAVDASLGVVVHSEWAAAAVRRARPEAPVARVPALIASPPRVDAAAVRRRLGLAPEQLLLGTFGLVNPAKRVDVALRAFARLLAEHPTARFLIVGEVRPEARLDPLLADLGAAVIQAGRAPDLPGFQALIAACDVGVNLRYPTAGETSAALLRLFAAGRPTVVSDVDAFSELPDDCCLKVGVGPDEEAELTRALLALAGDSALRRRLGDQARELARREHAPDVAARAYVQACEELGRRRELASPAMALAVDVAAALNELGLPGSGALAAEAESYVGQAARSILAELLPDSD